MISPTNPMDNVSNQPHEKHILFLDGECVICQRSARLLHKWDRVGEVYFSTLQGKTAAMLPAEWKRLTDERGRPAGTAVLVENAGRSDERRWRSADAIFDSRRVFLAYFGSFTSFPGSSRMAAIDLSPETVIDCHGGNVAARCLTRTLRTSFCHRVCNKFHL
jgi:hypothetical protein